MLIRKAFKDIYNIKHSNEVEILTLEINKNGYTIHHRIYPAPIKQGTLNDCIDYLAVGIVDSFLENKSYHHRFFWFANRRFNRIKKEHHLDEIILNPFQLFNIVDGIKALTDMTCPCCLTKLNKLEKDKGYQTLSEHVGNPNAESPLRPAYVCPKGCHTGIYGYDGSLYGGYNEPNEYQCAVHSMSYQLENWDLWECFSRYRLYELLEDFNEHIMRKNQKYNKIDYANLQKKKKE